MMPELEIDPLILTWIQTLLNSYFLRGGCLSFPMIGPLAVWSLAPLLAFYEALSAGI